MFKSLKSKIIVSHLIVTVTVAFIIGASGYYLMAKSLAKAQQSKIEVVASNKAENIREFFNRKKALMQQIINSMEFAEYSKTNNEQVLADYFAKFKDEIPYLSYINSSEKEKLSIVTGRISGELHDVSNKDFFSQALSSRGNVLVSPSGENSIDGELSVRLALAGHNNSGILLGYVPVSKLSENILKADSGDPIQISLIDNDGIVLYHPDNSRILTRLNGEGEVAEKLIAGARVFNRGGGRATVFGINGLIAYTPVDGMNWTVLVTLPYSDFISAPKKLRNYIVLIAAIIFIFAAWGSRTLASGITSPLVKIASASNAIAKGNLFQKVETSAKDKEITTLVESFNKMSSNLSHILISKDYVENIFQSIIDSIVIVDEKGNIKTVNSSTLDLLGYTKRELIGKPAGIIFGEDSGEGDIKKLRYMATNNQSMMNFAEEYVTKSHKHIPVIMSGSLLTDREGTGYDLVVVAKDITERKQSEVELQTLVMKLEQSNNELQDFAHIASHDLQEPLRKIRSFGERLRNIYVDALDDRGRDYLKRMLNAAERMQDLIESLLMYSRVTTKAQPFARVELSSVLQEVLSDLEVRIHETGGQIQAGDLPAINADPLQVRQLFQNLIGNALKFNREENLPVVKIYSGPAGQNGNGAYRGEEDNDMHEITIEDNGIGFDEKYVDRIFNVFQRLHGKQEYSGSGIGLSICRKIVERHGGTITAKSEPGQGARFIVTLPAAGEQEEKTDRPGLEAQHT